MRKESLNKLSISGRYGASQSLCSGWLSRLSDAGFASLRDRPLPSATIHAIVLPESGYSPLTTCAALEPVGSWSSCPQSERLLWHAGPPPRMAGSGEIEWQLPTLHWVLRGFGVCRVSALGLNRSRGKPLRCGVGVCGRASPWLCCEPRQSASFTTGASPWSHQVKPSRRYVNA